MPGKGASLVGGVIWRSEAVLGGVVVLWRQVGVGRTPSLMRRHKGPVRLAGVPPVVLKSIGDSVLSVVGPEGGVYEEGLCDGYLGNVFHVRDA